jgi:hypothetical protein
MSNPTSDPQYWAYFDEAWKKIIERFFPQFVRFFLPELFEAIDFEKPITFLDKELEQLGLQSRAGAKYVDKLVQVYLLDGSEQWILIHIEVQGDRDPTFSERMYRYFYKIFDRYGKPIVSVAILTRSDLIDDAGFFTLRAYGSGVDFRYLTFCLTDYDRAELDADGNPMALVVLASQERERARRRGDRFNIKLFLIRRLFERGYEREEIAALFEFIDWVIRLSDDDDERFWQEVKAIEEVNKMPFITTPQRIGLRQGFQQMVIEALDERFSTVPDDISTAIRQVRDEEMLKQLHRRAMRSASLDEFKQALNGEKSTKP